MHELIAHCPIVQISLEPLDRVVEHKNREFIGNPIHGGEWPTAK